MKKFEAQKAQEDAFSLVFFNFLIVFDVFCDGSKRPSPENFRRKIFVRKTCDPDRSCRFACFFFLHHGPFSNVSMTNFEKETKIQERIEKSEKHTPNMSDAGSDVLGP
jgi:hypothetical protein